MDSAWRLRRWGSPTAPSLTDSGSPASLTASPSSRFLSAPSSKSIAIETASRAPSGHETAGGAPAYPIRSRGSTPSDTQLERDAEAFLVVDLLTEAPVAL